jgi:hypothetical protein
MNGYNEITVQYCVKYGINFDLCYDIIHTFGDSKYSHEICEWLLSNTDIWNLPFGEICEKFNNKQN